MRIGAWRQADGILSFGRDCLEAEARGDCDSERSKGNQLRPSDLFVSGYERNTVDDACRCDYPARGMTGKVQFCRLLTDCDIEGPDVNSGKEVCKFWRGGVEGDSLQLRQFGQFPEDDADTPQDWEESRACSAGFRVPSKANRRMWVSRFSIPANPG